jgi:hypothetical protein
MSTVSLLSFSELHQNFARYVQSILNGRVDWKRGRSTGMLQCQAGTLDTMLHAIASVLFIF